MDSTADDDPAGELLDLTRALRGQLARHSAFGAWAAPGTATRRPEPAAGVLDAIPDVLDDTTIIPAGTLGRRTLAQIREEIG